MYYLINTFSELRGPRGGLVLSTHRSFEAAEKASAKLQRAVRLSNGPNSYIPTRIAVRLSDGGYGPYSVTYLRPDGTRVTVPHGEWAAEAGF